MSCVWLVRGRALSSSQVRRSGLSTSPDTKKSQVERSYVGTEPAWSTGHLSVRYWPGGSRAGSYPASTTFRSALPRNTPPTLVPVPGTALRIARRPRGFVGVTGPEAAEYLQRMLSNDVETLGPDESCEALLLTPKGRIVAPMTVYRRGPDDYLLLTEPEVAEALRASLLRSRLATKVDIELEEHESTVVVGRETPPGGIANREYGVAAYEVLDEQTP